MGARRAGALTLVLLLATLVLGAQTWRGGHASVPLLQAGVVAEPDGSLRTVSESAWAAQRDIDTVDPWLTVSRSASLPWLASGTVPGLAGPDAAMAVRALADLRVLTAPTGTSPGAVLAGPSGAWGYVWPRDAAFVAAAYARTGHQDDAIAVLLFLARQQEQDGSMQARYLADGSGQPPDDREAQEDGPGWSLWAAREVIDAAPDRASAAAATRALVPLVTRSTARLLDRIDPGTNLPAPSPDYWEVPESRLTLGIAATALMGLEAAADVYERGLVGDDAWWAAQFRPEHLAGRRADASGHGAPGVRPRLPAARRRRAGCCRDLPAAAVPALPGRWGTAGPARCAAGHGPPRWWPGAGSGVEAGRHLLDARNRAASARGSGGR